MPEKIEAVVDPATIDVTLLKKVTKSFTIQPELLVGSNQKVTDFETPTLDVMTVKITASQNQLNSIRIVKALIDCYRSKFKILRLMQRWRLMMRRVIE